MSYHVSNITYSEQTSPTTTFSSQSATTANFSGQTSSTVTFTEKSPTLEGTLYGLDDYNRSIDVDGGSIYYEGRTLIMGRR
jgi:hypothetical protein